MKDNNIGYSDHGKGPLSPPEPQFKCQECNAFFWGCVELNSDGVCESCESDFCNDCGRYKDGGFCQHCRYMASLD